MITWRRFDEAKDYAEVVEWWKAHKWTPVPLDCLGQFGIMIEDEFSKICAVWVILTNTKIAWMEFLVGNPSVKPRRLREGIELAVISSIELAKQAGATRVFTSLNKRALARVYQSCGFEKTDEGVTHFIARIDPCQVSLQ